MELAPRRGQAWHERRPPSRWPCRTARTKSHVIDGTMTCPLRPAIDRALRRGRNERPNLTRQNMPRIEDADLVVLQSYFFKLSGMRLSVYFASRTMINSGIRGYLDHAEYLDRQVRGTLALGAQKSIGRSTTVDLTSIAGHVAQTHQSSRRVLEVGRLIGRELDTNPGRPLSFGRNRLPRPLVGPPSIASKLAGREERPEHTTTRTGRHRLTASQQVPTIRAARETNESATKITRYAAPYARCERIQGR